MGKITSLKDLNKCPKCGKEMAVLRNGKKLCFTCIKKEREKK